MLKVSDTVKSTGEKACLPVRTLRAKELSVNPLRHLIFKRTPQNPMTRARTA